MGSHTVLFTTLATLVTLLMLTTPMLANDSPADELDPATGPEFRMQTRTLASGMQLVVLPQPGARLVSVEMFHRAGAFSDPDSLEGLAHFAEHLLMDSAGDLADGELTRRLHLYTTRSNASTGPAAMRFTSQCLPEFLDDVLALEAQRLRGVVLDSLAFERERQVISEELSYRVRLSPYHRFLQQLVRSSYPDHPLGRSIGGSGESLRRVARADIQHFVAQRIQAPSAVLVLSGAVADLNIDDIVEHAFGFLPASPPAEIQPTPYPARTSRQWIGDAADFEGFMVGVACRIPIDRRRDATMAAALVEFLREIPMGVSVRSVPGEVVVLLHGSWIYYRPEKDPDSDYYIGGASFDAEQSAQRILGRLWRTLGERIEELGREKEFERLRGLILEELRSAVHDPNLGEAIGRTMIAGDIPVLPDSLAHAIESLTLLELQDFAARYLTPENATVGVCHGADSGRQAAIDLADRTPVTGRLDAPDPLEQLGQEAIAPVLEAYGRADLFDLELVRLPDGLPMFHLESRNTDHWHLAGIKSFSVLKDLRPGKKPGLEHLYNRVVTYGETEYDARTQTRTPRELPYELDLYLVPDQLAYRADGPAHQAAKIAGAVVDRLRYDDFNTTRWSQVLAVAEETLAGRSQAPANAARAWRLRQMFGEESPIPAHWAPGSSVAGSVKYSDLQKLHGKVADDLVNTTLVSIGPLSAPAAAEIVAEQFDALGEYRTKKIGKPKTPEIPQRQGRIFPDLESGDVRVTVSFGLQPLPRDSESFGLCVLYFEDLLRARLKSRLRERTGLTYHVQCSATVHGGALLWEIQATAQPGQAPDVLAELEAELERIRAEGFTRDEWARAKLVLIGDTISRLSDVDSAAVWLLRLARLGTAPADPEAALHALSAESVLAELEGGFSIEPRVFTVTGPMFEEDLDQFETRRPAQE